MDTIDILLDAARQVFQYPVEADTPISGIPGSSLQLLHFKAIIEKKTGCSIPIEQLFEVSDVRALANVLPQFERNVTSGNI